MNATEFSTANLAIRRISDRIEPRVTLRRLHVAYHEIVAGAKRMPKCWYDLTRNRPTRFPFERDREYVHAAIREGATTPDRVISWRLKQLADDLAQFSEPLEMNELFFVRLICEQAEAADAQTRAHAMPTSLNRDLAIKETEEAWLLGRLYCALLRGGRAMLHLPTAAL
jgi:hypothetical protein